MAPARYLEQFSGISPSNGEQSIPHGTATFTDMVLSAGVQVPRFTNEFWTSQQRKASSLHEISYRACFKPQLPAFFIRLLTEKSDRVYDPFSGRGTTVIEAGLLGRQVAANDINPLSRILTLPRFFIPGQNDVVKRLSEIPRTYTGSGDIDLSMFYDAGTEEEIRSLREYLLEKEKSGTGDHIDAWIRMVATNRLTGHSAGFFSVYTLPPNQAVTAESQVKINRKRSQVPQYRDTHALIIRKSRSLARHVTEGIRQDLRGSGNNGLFLTGDSRHTPQIADESVALTVTSPPFLDIVQYSKDNWLRCWFNGIDDREIAQKITVTRSIDEWSSVMGETFSELFRVTSPGGHVAFEVGEVRKGTIRLDEEVVPLGIRAGFECIGIVVNRQNFTKTSNIWGIGNNDRGTNTNRIVVFKKEEK